MKTSGMGLLQFFQNMNFFKGLVFFLSLFLAFQACQTSAKADTGLIYGFVYDANEIPLRSASMSLTGPNGYSESTKSTEDGYYEFDGLAAGDYTLLAEKSGYQSQTIEISLGSGETYEVDDIKLEEEESGAIYGYVLDINGDPVENAKLTIKGLTTKYSSKTATDQDGFFEFPELEPDNYVIIVKKKRYKTTKTSVELEEEGEKKEIEIELRATKKRTILPEEAASAVE
jgi:uncharacterized membrane protein